MPPDIAAALPSVGTVQRDNYNPGIGCLIVAAQHGLTRGYCVGLSGNQGIRALNKSLA
jgi:hypothetical protein